MESSESDEDDYLPESAFHRPFRRLTKNRTRLPENESTRTKRPVTDGKSGNRLTRSNSEANSVSIQDIRSENPCKLRKNSCNCAACGGEKLAKRILFTSIPIQETERTGKRQGSISALETLIRNCRSGSLLLPIIGNYRLSALLKPVPNQIFISPPATPHLSRFLSPQTTRSEGKKGKAGARATAFSSPLQSRDKGSDTRALLRTTPSTSSAKSLGNTRKSRQLPCSQFSTHPRSLF